MEHLLRFVNIFSIFAFYIAFLRVFYSKKYFFEATVMDVIILFKCPTFIVQRYLNFFVVCTILIHNHPVYNSLFIMINSVDLDIK